MTRLHKLCAGCTAAGTNYMFMTDIGAYMCDCCASDEVIMTALGGHPVTFGGILASRNDLKVPRDV